MVNPRDLRGFGDETENYTFKDTLDWFVHVRDPAEVFKAQPTYFLSEWSYVIIAFLLYCGGPLEVPLAGVLPSWLDYGDGLILDAGHRQLLALTDHHNVSGSQTSTPHTLDFNEFILSPAGLVEVLIDIPYDIMAVKFVHWTWHDTDPNIYDRHYWVPWNSYYFHLAFGTAFTFALNFWRRKITGSDDKGEVSSPGKEIVCAFLAGLCGMPGGVIQFIFLYHPLHDTYGIHTENCTLAIVLVYFLIVWAADRTPRVTSRRQKGEKSHWSVIIIVLNMVIHYGLYLSMAVFGKPEEEVSIGLHERTGPCDEKTDVYTAFGGVLKRQTYLCTDDYDEKYYDFHCLPGGQRVSDGMEWYTICGTPFPNRAEYISVIVLVCVVSAVIFYNLLFRSSRTLLYQKKKETKLKFN
ncbi:hypothetical protein Hamer_G015958 [Homarus americanus]|uniref:DUF7802 domain-containing protein n=1 Tax=Homarus americanus TaxID=6706 RepID=A0A8J5JFL7_HOMAM|nr:hypothetical protein Hamer_G015958 [Homarus americanus]